MKTVGKTKIRSVRAAARPMPRKVKAAATKLKYLTCFRFYELTDPEVPLTHPAMRLQKEDFNWPIYLVRTRRGVVVAAGCRWLTLDKARAHWAERSKYLSVFDGLPHERIQGRARKMLALLPKLRQRARRLGWL